MNLRIDIQINLRRQSIVAQSTASNIKSYTPVPIVLPYLIHPQLNCIAKTQIHLNCQHKPTMFPLRSLLPASALRAGAAASILPRIPLCKVQPTRSMSSLFAARGSLQSTLYQASDAVRQSGSQIRGMKTRSSVKRLCDGCKVRTTSPWVI